MSRKTPVIIGGANFLSGVTTWADRVRTALANHPRYDVKLLQVGRGADGSEDLIAENQHDVAKLLAELAPAVFIPNYMWDLYLTAFQPGIRCLGMCHSDNVDEYYRPLSWYEPLIAKFIAVSHECESHLKQVIPHRTKDISMLPYGVCVPDVLQRQYQTRPLRLIYAGRVTQRQKRVRDFVPLVEELLRAKVPFTFDIVGSGDEYKSLEKMMRSRVPAADVNFHPRAPHWEMPAKWLSHDVFIQVSDFEGTSVSMLEAMAHGLVCVVTAASSGVTGVINDSSNGFVVPVGDMKAMAQAIARLAQNPSLLEDLGHASYRSSKPYAMDLYAQQFVKILDDTVAGDAKFDYGPFSPRHPLFLQQEIVEQRPIQTREPRKRKLKTLFRNRVFRIGRSKTQPNSAGDMRAA